MIEIIIVLTIALLIFSSSDSMGGIAAFAFVGFLLMGIIDVLLNGFDYFINHGTAYMFIAVVVLAIVIAIVVWRTTKDKALVLSFFFSIASGGTLIELIIIDALCEVCSLGADILLFFGWAIIPLVFLWALVLMAMVCIAAVGVPMLVASVSETWGMHSLITASSGMVCAIVFVLIICESGQVSYLVDSFGVVFS